MTALFTFDELVALCPQLGLRDCPCPFCGPSRRSPANRKRKTMRVWHKEPGFISYRCARCDAQGYARASWETSTSPRPARDDDRARQQCIEFALALWGETVPLIDTLGQRYFAERRQLDIGQPDHALRWHQDIGAVVALMTDPITNRPTGVHRTFLNPDGTKRERKMLGRQGVVRISPDEEVTMGLGIAEGVEDAIAIMLSGWTPVWAATSAGAIARFPVLQGIEAITIFADADEIGMQAAETCAGTWINEGREARIAEPEDYR